MWNVCITNAIQHIKCDIELIHFFSLIIFCNLIYI